MNNLTVQVGKVPQINKHVAVVEIEASAPLPKTGHTILVLDCSGSMAGSLDDVRRDSQKYVAEMGEKDFASVIIFSGHGTSRLIAGPTQCNPAGREMLKRAIEKEVRVLDTTVFSEPLAMTISTVSKLSGKDTVHNAVLFTDGCAVPTRWSVQTEAAKAIAAARELRASDAAVSVVGYGVYYDQKFLTELMEAAGNSGIYRHISEIEDFGPAVQAVRDAVRKTTPISLDLVIAPNKGAAGRVFKTTPEVAFVGKDGEISTRGLYEGKVTLFIELTGPCTELSVHGLIGDQKYAVTFPTSPITPENAADYVRVLGAHAFLTGDRQTAAELLDLCGEAGLSEKAGAAYTDRERRETGDTVRRYFRDRKFIGAGLKPTGPNHCVLNVLRTLIEDEGNVVYLAKGAYKRSGELHRDPRVIEPPHGRVLKAVGYASHQERFNFSIRCQKDVKVMPEDMKGSPVDMKIWRSYNVILDGNLHLPELEAVLTKPSFEALRSAGVIGKDEAFRPGKPYAVNLRGLKMISGNWANPRTLGLVNLLREEAELEAEQKALNARRKALAVGASESELEAGGIYRESAGKVEALPVETYQAACVEIRLMKYKARDYDVSGLGYDQADARVKEVRQRLIVVRYLIRSIAFAMEATGSKAIAWDAGKTTQRGQYPKLEQTATFDGAVLKRVTWTEECVCS